MYTVKPPNNRHIGNRFLVLCREVGIKQTRSQTTLCLARHVPKLPRLGAPAPIACGPNHAIHISRVTPLCWNGKTQHSNGDHVYKCASHCGSVRSRRLFYIQLRSFWSLSVSVVQSREVVHISEVRNTLDVCYKSIGAFRLVHSTEVVASRRAR